MHSLQHTLGLTLLSVLGSGLLACGGGGGPAADLGHGADAGTHINPGAPKGVYTMSNDPSDNRIYVYSRAADGTLSALNSFSTGGKGAGAGLGNQNGLTFDSAQNLFFAVNAGDNSISMLALKTDGSLALLAKVPSGGIRPISITNWQNTVYVLNAGDLTMPANISGFQISGTGLSAIPNSMQPLSMAAPGPAQIQFAPGGKVLVVTEKMTSMITTYTVNAGVASAPIAQASKGMTPFGFAFSAGEQLIVSEAAGGNANQGSTSSYVLSTSGMLTSVSIKITSNQTAPCWVAVAGAYAYVANAGTNNITGYKIATDGSLSLLGNGVSASTGMGPTDEDATDDNAFLYVLNARDHSLGAYAINADGSLTRKQDYTGIPTTANGLVAR